MVCALIETKSEKSISHISYTLTTQRERDPESGLMHYRARSYDPRLGRFVQKDPMGMIDGPNMYVYVRNNPIRSRDPWGNETEQERAAGIVDFIEKDYVRTSAQLGELYEMKGLVNELLYIAQGKPVTSYPPNTIYEYSGPSEVTGPVDREAASKLETVKSEIAVEIAKKERDIKDFNASLFYWRNVEKGNWKSTIWAGWLSIAFGPGKIARGIVGNDPSKLDQEMSATERWFDVLSGMIESGTIVTTDRTVDMLARRMVAKTASLIGKGSIKKGFVVVQKVIKAIRGARGRDERGGRRIKMSDKTSFSRLPVGFYDHIPA